MDAPQDRRGKRKSEDEMSEVEKLRAQNKLLQAENRRKQMEIDLLKKLDEIERRRF
ncbi:helix-turn-helix domain protein [Paenibacillus phage vB_PlaS-2/A]|nr:helix-turn-helix domain protein [Paenibacillus phage vB_PlaS-2/A]